MSDECNSVGYEIGAYPKCETRNRRDSPIYIEICNGSASSIYHGLYEPW